MSPCKQLSPVLEKLAIEGAGSWVLAKIDVDANPRIAQAFRVQGIPMVFAVVGGQPVDAFTGVIPESQLRTWIDAVLTAGGVETVTPEDPNLIAADDGTDRRATWTRPNGRTRRSSPSNPADEAAQAGLAQVGLLRRIEGVDPAKVLAAAARPPPTTSRRRGSRPTWRWSTGQAERAYQRLVDLVRRTAGDEREQARDASGVVVRDGRAGRPGRHRGSARPRQRAVLSRLSRICAASPSSTRRRTSASGPRPRRRCRAARRRPGPCVTMAWSPGSARATPAATHRRGSTPASGARATA